MIVWQDLLAASALVLVIAGMLPFVKPEKWRIMMSSVAKQPDNALRFIGLISMLLGLGLLYIVR